jgi:hypothetical protein
MQDNINTNFSESYSELLDRIYLSEGRDKWGTFVIAARFNEESGFIKDRD